MDAAEDARYRIRNDIETDIQGYDIDGDVIKSARENAKLAGVDHLIHFQQRPVAELSHPKKYGFLITNPPYGERLRTKRSSGPVSGIRRAVPRSRFLVDVSDHEF